MLKTTVAKLLSVKLAAAAAAATAATGGVALAAATNNLPDAAQSAAHDVFNAPSPDSKASQVTDTAGKPDAKSTHAPKGTPSPSLRGLCNAYQAGATSNDGKAKDNPAFKALFTAAGGADKVAAYCTNLVGAPSTHPSGKPTSAPTGAPESHPSGKPTALPTAEHPSSEPTSAPSGPPSTHPSKP